MCFGLPGSTAMMSRLPAKSCGAPVLPATLSMLPASAVASTSAGAPCCSCVTRSLLPAKSKVTFTSGCAAVNWSPSWVKASVSDDAAKTVSSRCPPPEAPDELPHPAASAMSAASRRTAARETAARLRGAPSP